MPIGAALGVKLYRYRSLIRRHWWVLALTIGLGLAYQSYVTFKKPRLFESISRLNIREELIQDFKAGWADTTGNFFGTSIEQLKSPVVLGRASERVKLVAPQAERFGRYWRQYHAAQQYLHGQRQGHERRIHSAIRRSRGAGIPESSRRGAQYDGQGSRREAARSVADYEEGTRRSEAEAPGIHGG